MRDTHLGEPRDVELVQLVHVITCAAEEGRHVQGDDVSVEGGLGDGGMTCQWNYPKV